MSEKEPAQKHVDEEKNELSKIAAPLLPWLNKDQLRKLIAEATFNKTMTGRFYEGMT